jgi:hypothetical protein
MGGFVKSGLSVKNSMIDMLKEPVVNEETQRMQREYMEKMDKSNNSPKE